MRLRKKFLVRFARAPPLHQLFMSDPPPPPPPPPPKSCIRPWKQFLNRELRTKRGFTNKQWKIVEVLLHPVYGLLHREAEHFLKRMATCVASKWKKSYAQTCGYIRARLSFAIIRAASLCLRVKWGSGLGFEDGAALYSIMH